MLLELYFWYVSSHFIYVPYSLTAPVSLASSTLISSLPSVISSMFATLVVHAIQSHSFIHFVLCFLLHAHSTIPHLPPFILLNIPHLLEHYRKGVLVVCNTYYEHLHCKLKDKEDMQRSVLLSYSAINLEFMGYFIT